MTVVLMSSSLSGCFPLRVQFELIMQRWLKYYPSLSIFQTWLQPYKDGNQNTLYHIYDLCIYSPATDYHYN